MDCPVTGFDCLTCDDTCDLATRLAGVSQCVDAAWAELERQKGLPEPDTPYIDREIDLIDGRVDMPALVRAVLDATSADDYDRADVELAQALLSGRLRGDEFRTIAERLPRFTTVAACSLGLSPLEFAAAAKAGEIRLAIERSAQISAQPTRRSDAPET